MSSDHGLGAPSFGDLFEDPDAPAAPAEVPAPASPTPTADVEAEAADPADVDVTAAAGEEADAAGSRAIAAPAVTAPDAAVPEHDEPTDPGLPVAPERAEPSEIAQDDDADDRAEDRTPEVAAAAAAGIVAGAVTVTPTGSVTVAPAAPTTTPPAPVTTAPARPTPAPGPTPAAEPSTSGPAPDPTSGDWDGTVDPAVSSAPAARVDTGRLYRSSGAEGPATLDAIPAIDPDRPPARPARRVDTAAATSPRAEAGLTYSGVVVVVGAVTVLAAFAEALLRHELGVITGLALLVSSVYAAVVVRRPDIWAAVVVPPLAFLAAALTAGQLTLDKSGGLLIREGFGLFRALATNAPWILGTTVVCLVVVLVRRRRA